MTMIHVHILTFMSPTGFGTLYNVQCISTNCTRHNELSVQVMHKSTLLQGFQLIFKNSNDYFLNIRMEDILINMVDLTFIICIFLISYILIL